MKKSELAEKIYNISYLTGNFTLRSGQTSNEYFDKYLFESNPILLEAISQRLAETIPKGIKVLAGLEMGGIPIATAISLISKIPVVFVRKKAKEYGTCKLSEGISVYKKKTCIIEDVVTTGGQIIESVKELRGRGAIIDTVVCVIERDIKGRNNLKKEGLELISLFEMDELKKAK
jgi:orotate phosphoribosyltransferase